MNDPGAESFLTGCIEGFSYHERAAGWLFHGWIARSLAEVGPMQIAARFSDRTVPAGAVPTFFERSDVRRFGVGLVLFAQTKERSRGELVSLAIQLGDRTHHLPLRQTVERLPSDQIDVFLRKLLTGAKLVGNSVSVASMINGLTERATEAPTTDNPTPAGKRARRGQATAKGPSSIEKPRIPPEFDEKEYLRQRPEVAEAIAKGHLPNALFHYRLFGARARPDAPIVQQPVPGQDDGAELKRRSNSAVVVPKSFGPSNVDVVITSTSGAVFVIGWANDRYAAINQVTVEFENGEVSECPGDRLARFRRADAEAAVGIEQKSHLGFCALLFHETKAGTARLRVAKLIAADGSIAEFPVKARVVGDIELRDLMLGYLSGIEFIGNRNVEAFYALDGYLGQALVQYNRTITQSIVGAATFERFEARPHRFKGSIVVCLYGKPEFQFVQNALFSAGTGAADYEYIYVSNSPELIEVLCKSAEISQRIYGLSVTIVMLPGNAGFGAANNIAASYARSRRILIVNPDVFPMDRAWAVRHDQLVEQTPTDRTKLFGARLFYADGSMMHGGMYLDVDWGVSIAGLEIRRRPMLRVEHYGKGAPRDLREFGGSRPVSAVSGAFMSIDRGWFERLGGFAEDYIFGHYEDADLCLRSLDQGAVTWIHNLDFWHMEGKGSTRMPHHEGASLVNRWLFTREWYNRVVPELLGRVEPSLPTRLQVAS